MNQIATFPRDAAAALALHPSHPHDPTQPVPNPLPKLLNPPLVPRPDRTAARERLSAADLHIRFPVGNPDKVTAYRLLDGAWDRVPVVAARYGMDPQTLTDALDGYLTGLLVFGVAHEFDHTVRLLTQIKVNA